MQCYAGMDLLDSYSSPYRHIDNPLIFQRIRCNLNLGALTGTGWWV